MNTFEGNVVEIIFRNNDNGYTVAVLQTADGDEITFVGYFADLKEGDIINIKGNIKNHNLYGLQIEVTSYESVMLTTDKSIFNYLASGAIEDIGPKLAERIVNKFGKDTLKIMEKSPEKLLEVEGIGIKKLNKIIASFMTNHVQRNTLKELMSYGISTTMALKIYKAFGELTLEIIRDNPYKLASEIRGIGFLKADEIASKMGFDMNSIKRIKEGIKYVLEDMSFQGDTFSYVDVLKQKCIKILNTDDEKYEEALYEIILANEVIVEERDGNTRIYLEKFFNCEKEIAYKLLRLCNSDSIEKKFEKSADTIILEAEDRLGKKLAEKQKEAVVSALKNQIMILTGGPGTGKTTIISFMIDCFEKLGKKIKLCAPTGRAAKRMTEATGIEAKTIHRLLEVGFVSDDSNSYYNRNEENPINADVVIVDEMSMVDIFLMRALLNAIKEGTIVVFVGDKDQLQSVGAGRVLCDMIDSQVINTVTLNEIFRQSKESSIIINAHRVNNGEEIEIKKGDEDFFFMARGERYLASELVVELISDRLPNYFNIKPTDIQILSPIKKTELGVVELNSSIQQRLNPPGIRKTEFKHYDRVFRLGDKIMQIKNNYEKEYTSDFENGKGVFNGDIGFISFIDNKVKEFYITWDDKRESKYTFDEADNIELAYAMTVHKSQGSEFDIVIIPILSLPPMMQTRNILYTALTRAKKKVVLVGSMYQIKKMIENKNKEERNSSLCEKLQDIKKYVLI